MGIPQSNHPLPPPFIHDSTLFFRPRRNQRHLRSQQTHHLEALPGQQPPHRVPMPSDKRKEPSTGRARGTNRRESKATSSSRQPTTGPSFTLNSIPGKTTADKRRVSGREGNSSAIATCALTVGEVPTGVGIEQQRLYVVNKAWRDCHLMRRYLLCLLTRVPPKALGRGLMLPVGLVVSGVRSGNFVSAHVCVRAGSLFVYYPNTHQQRVAGYFFVAVLSAAAAAAAM